VVVEEILNNGGTPRRERVGHAFMSDNYCADSGMITLVHMLNIISSADISVAELIRPLRRYSSSGEINFRVADKQAMMDELARKYKDGEIDHLDGITIRYKQWWFNCRPSNTEPLLRLNIEAKSKELLDEKFAELTSQLGEPV